MNSHVVKIESTITKAGISVYESLICVRNRAYPENTNFQTFAPRNWKFYSFGDLHQPKKC